MFTAALGTLFRGASRGGEVFVLGCSSLVFSVFSEGGYPNPKP